MNSFAKRALLGTLVAGGITLLSATVANAAETTGEDGLLSGTQALIQIAVPVDITGNGISILGDSTASAAPAAPAAPAEAAPAPAPVTSGADGIGSGTQALISVDVPVTVTGNSIAVIGDTEATPAAPAPAAPAPAASAAAPAAAPVTSGEDGIVGGTQVLPVVNIPVTISDNAVSVLGDSSAESSAAPAGPAPTTPAATPAEGAVTSGEDGILGGTQLAPVVSLPITAGGNAVSVLGDSTVSGQSAATPAGAAPAGVVPVTSGIDGILGGTQIAPVVSLPITLGGNAVSVIGDSTTAPGTVTPTTPVTPTDPTTPVDPATPVTPTNPVTPTTSGAGAVAVAAPAAVRTAQLATTGAPSVLISVLIGLALIGAGALSLRRRQSV